MTITRNATISREAASTDDGYYGNWLSDSGFRCVTGEDPDLDNKPEVSCVPFGRYICLWQWSKSHGRNVYHLQNVPGRTNCEIHSGNLCGNKPKGEESDVCGCIIVGKDFGTFAIGQVVGKHPPLKKAQRGVVSSVEALAKLEADMRDSDGQQMAFWLTIK